MTTQNVCRELGITQYTVKTELCETLYPHFFDTDPLPNLNFNQNKKNLLDQEIEPVDLQVQATYYPETLDQVRDRILAAVD